HRDDIAGRNAHPHEGVGGAADEALQFAIAQPPRCLSRFAAGAIFHDRVLAGEARRLTAEQLVHRAVDPPAAIAHAAGMGIPVETAAQRTLSIAGSCITRLWPDWRADARQSAPSGSRTCLP